MEQGADVLIKGTQYEQKFLLEAENENLLKNLAALRRVLWDMRAHLCQLEKSIAESQAIKEEVDCLQAELNATAERLGVPFMTTGPN
jgi:hypothetical protein